VPKDQKLVQQVATLIKSNINNFEGDNKKFMADVLQKLTAPKTTAAAAQPAQQAANVAQQAAAAAPAAPAAPGAPQK
jgi:biotin carboxyl carrier protein